VCDKTGIAAAIVFSNKNFFWRKIRKGFGLCGYTSCFL